MNMKNIKPAAKHAIRVTKRFMHKHGPMIASVTSTLCTIGGTVWACKKTLKIKPELDARHAQRELIEDKKELRKSYISEAAFVAKSYAGPVLTLTAGEALKFGAVVSLERTVGELTLGVAALQSQVNELKKGLVDAVGEEKADDIIRGIEEDDETCEPNIYQSKIKGLSPYAVVFDENHPWWKETPEYRYHNFRMAQCHLNDILVARSAASDPRKRKPVLTNDIYEELHYPDTELGSHSGYWFDPQNHPEVDNMIEFIFVDPETGKRIDAFPEGIVKPVYIDFNVNYGYVTKFLEVC